MTKKKMTSARHRESQDGDYSVFIAGETIDLCAPSTLAIYRDGWADWFNDVEVTKHLPEQGLFPNTVDDQIEFVEQLRNRPRLALLICLKESQKAIGTISLSDINFQLRSANVSLVFGVHPRQRNLYALEAMARMTEHGFENMGLWRIAAAQVYPELRGWNKRMELLGYRTEGIARSMFVKGHTRKDIIFLACLYEDYRKLKELREGQYWLGEEHMFKLLKALPKKGFSEVVHEELERLSENYFCSLKQL